MSTNIVLCGVGGQGTVLASKLLAAAAMAKGINVMSAETIGMAQRGGSVFSHLRIGNDASTPMIAKGEADMIIGFEPAEAVRLLPTLKEGGCVVVNSKPIMPVTASLGGMDYKGTEMLDYLKSKVKNLIIVDGEAACEEIGSPKVLNMVLLGAAVHSGFIDISDEEIKKAIENKVKPQFVEMNFKAIDYVK